MTDVLDPVALSSWAKDDSRDEELTPEQELEKLRAEKKALQMRVLGVNELARLLQDRTSELKIMEEKNKRLEVAVVRLENRCSNFEKKLKSQSGVLPKSGQMPLIPGPSRQILDSLMKENAELKKVINKQTSKGPTSYLEAVKTFQLEEMVEQQRQDIEFYKSQLTSLGLSDNMEDEKAVSMPAAGEPPGVGNVRTLKLKLAKLQQTMRVKDKFCTLLSDRVALLEKQLSDQAPLQSQSPDPYQQPQSLPPTSLQVAPNMTAKSAEMGTQVDGEEAQPRPEVLRELDEKLAKKEAELGEKESLIKRLQQQNDDLTYYNKTLVDEKRSQVPPGSGQDVDRLQKELRDVRAQCEDLQRRLESVESEKRSLVEQVDDHVLQRGLIESQLSNSDKEHRQKSQDMIDKIEVLQEDLEVANNKIRDLLTERSQLDVELKKYKSVRTAPMPQPMPQQQAYAYRASSGMVTGGYNTPAYSLDPHLDTAIVRDYGGLPKTVAATPQRFSNVDTVTRPPMVLARSVPDQPEPTPAPHHPQQQRPHNLPPPRPGITSQYHNYPAMHTPGGGLQYSYSIPGAGGHHPMAPSATGRPPQDPNIRPPQRYNTSPVTNPSFQQGYMFSKPHPSTTAHPSLSSLGSMGSSAGSSLGYYSGTSSFSDMPQGQSQGGMQGTQGGQQQQQGGGGGHHGYTGPQ